MEARESGPFRGRKGFLKYGCSKRSKVPLLRTRLLLTASFVSVICVPPLLQIGWEVVSGSRVQITDLFSHWPDEQHLRQFEDELEARSIVRREAQRCFQRVTTLLFGSAGPQVVNGRNGWLFYKPSIRYLVGALAPSGELNRQRSQPDSKRAALDRVERAIVNFKLELENRDIRLLVIPVPSKASIYPDRLTGRMESRATEFRSPTQDLIQRLHQQGVETVDLFTLFQQARRQNPGTLYYLERDTHWTPAGAYLAAEAVVSRLRDLDWVPETFFERDYSLRQVAAEFPGDLVKMMPGGQLTGLFPPERVECRQVVDDFDGRVYRSIRDEVPILFLGDSFSRIYHRDLPGSAGFVAHVAYQLGMPLEEIVLDGGGASEVRKHIITEHADYFQDKRLVLWEFVEREIGLAPAGWDLDVDLP